MKGVPENQNNFPFPPIVDLLHFNRIPGYFEGCAEIFSLAKQRVNFMQKELAKRNIYTNFGTSKRDIQRVKITHTLSKRGIELRAIHSGFYSGVNCTSRSI
jgi:hypothetical protein